MNTRSILAASAAVMLVVGVGGAAIGANLALLGADPDASSIGQLEIVTARAELDTVQADEGAEDPSASSSPVAITAEAAIAIAMAEVGGTFVEIEWETEQGRSLFEVELRLADGQRIEVSVDAADGAVLEVEREHRLEALVDRAEERMSGSAPSPTTTIDAARALDIAVAAAGGTLVEMERDREDGNDVYSVELSQEDGRIVELEIDAVTGVVLSMEASTGSEDDQDDDDERAWSGVTDALSSSAAVDIARDAIGGGDLVEVERGEELGHATWEVELRQGGDVTEVVVDAVSGEVLEIDLDD